MRHITVISSTLWVLSASSLLVACGRQDNNAFSDAIPAESLVSMDFPGADASSATASGMAAGVATADAAIDVASDAAVDIALDAAFDAATRKSVVTEDVESASCYDGTVELVKRANNTVKYVLNALDTITDYRYKKIGDNTYQWGPWDDSDSGLTKRLIVTVAEDGGYSYSFDAAVTGTEDFLSLVLGDIDAGSTRSSGSGNFVVNLDSREALEQTGTMGGVETFFYEQDELSNRSIYFTLSDYLFANGQRDNAILDFMGNADGTGMLDWFRNRDVYDDASGEALKEDLAYRSRWLSDHSGRCDGKTQGGDLGTHLVTVHQCWDTSTAQVYYQSELDAEVRTTEGDSTACSYADISYAEAYSASE